MTVPRLREKRVFKCKGCGLEGTALKRVIGAGSMPAKIMFMGLAPDKKDDRDGKPFTGDRGKQLFQIIEKAVQLSGVEFPTFYMTYMLQCRPTDRFQGQCREPENDEILVCKEQVMKVYGKVKPEFVVFTDKLAERYYKKLFSPNETILDPEFIYETGGMQSPYFLSTARRLAEIIKEID